MGRRGVVQLTMINDHFIRDISIEAFIDTSVLRKSNFAFRNLKRRYIVVGTQFRNASQFLIQHTTTTARYAALFLIDTRRGRNRIKSRILG